MRQCSTAALFLLLWLFSEEISCSFSRQQRLLSQFRARLQEKTAAPFPLPTATLSEEKAQSKRVFYPHEYGADPTGKNDSTDAIQNALDDACQIENGGHELLPGIKNLGGVIIDFQGGSYKISKPIIFPSGKGNVLVTGGTLRASASFPKDRHLMELWSTGYRKLKKQHESDSFSAMKDQSSGINYEAITFRDILFDSNFAGGGLFVINSARIRIDNCFFLHFATDGILVREGHETFISGCFLGQHSTVGGSYFEKKFSGVGIDLSGNDIAVTDVVIFSAATGIIVRGQANIITGVHCYNKATAFGGVGIRIESSASAIRIVDSYMDYNSIVIEDPTRIHVTNGFFLGAANIVLKSVSGKISGLTVLNNMFSSYKDLQNPKPIVELDGKFDEIDQVFVEKNVVHAMILKSTAGKRTVSGNGTRWKADFSKVLLFPNRIRHFQYSFMVRANQKVKFVAHAVTNLSHNSVVVESDRDVNAVVSVEVDQYIYDYNEK